MKRWLLLIFAVLCIVTAFKIRQANRFRANWETNARACIWEVVRSVEMGKPLVGKTNLQPSYLTVVVVTNGAAIDVMVQTLAGKPKRFVVTAISAWPEMLMLTFDSAAPERGIVKELF
jgi:hypothetical protein